MPEKQKLATGAAARALRRHHHVARSNLPLHIQVDGSADEDGVRGVCLHDPPEDPVVVVWESWGGLDVEVLEIELLPGSTDQVDPLVVPRDQIEICGRITGRHGLDDSGLRRILVHSDARPFDLVGGNPAGSIRECFAEGLTEDGASRLLRQDLTHPERDFFHLALACECLEEFSGLVRGRSGFDGKFLHRSELPPNASRRLRRLFLRREGRRGVREGDERQRE